MNNNLVKQLIEKSFNGTISFPEVVMALSKEGFESYHVDYLRGEARYYHQSGESLLEKHDHPFPSVAENFSPEGVQAAIKRSQAGVIKYPEFLKESAAAGCSYYIVCIKGKKVRYFGRDGGEHIENFPGAK